VRLLPHDDAKIAVYAMAERWNSNRIEKKCRFRIDERNVRSVSFASSSHKCARSFSRCSTFLVIHLLIQAKETTMKLTTIALAMTFALAGTFAVAQGGPNGTAGGPTSLSGTGPSTSGGDFTRRGWP